MGIWKAPLVYRQWHFTASTVSDNPTLKHDPFDFLIDRPQLVQIDSGTSSLITIHTGTSQGCVLSPLIYSLYITFNFADDTVMVGQVMISQSTIGRLQIQLNFARMTTLL